MIGELRRCLPLLWLYWRGCDSDSADKYLTIFSTPPYPDAKPQGKSKGGYKYMSPFPLVERCVFNQSPKVDL